MPGFWAGIAHGGFRKVVCPYCRRAQLVARNPMPFDRICKACGKPFRVTKEGVKVLPQK